LFVDVCACVCVRASLCMHMHLRQCHQCVFVCACVCGKRTATGKRATLIEMACSDGR
jgi:hypothetical protein